MADYDWIFVNSDDTIDLQKGQYHNIKLRDEEDKIDENEKDKFDTAIQMDEQYAIAYPESASKSNSGKNTNNTKNTRMYTQFGCKSRVKGYLKIYIVEPLFLRDDLIRSLKNSHTLWGLASGLITKIEKNKPSDGSDESDIRKIMDDKDRKQHTQNFVNNINTYMSYYSHIKNLNEIIVQGNVEDSSEPTVYAMVADDNKLKNAVSITSDNQLCVEEFKMVYYDSNTVNRSGDGGIESMIKNIDRFLNSYALPVPYKAVCVEDCRYIEKFVDTSNKWCDSIGPILYKDSVIVLTRFNELLGKAVASNIGTTYLSGDAEMAKPISGRVVYDPVYYINFHTLAIVLLQFIQYCNDESGKLSAKLLLLNKQSSVLQQVTTAKTITLTKNNESPKKMEADLAKFKIAADIAKIFIDILQKCNQQELKWNIALFVDRDHIIRASTDENRIMYVQCN